MLGYPGDTSPIRDKRPSAVRSKFERPGFVSLWAGSLGSVEAAEAYFGCPDEIGVSLPADAFAADFALGEFPPELLEVNFEQVAPRPLADLLGDATFAASYRDLALEAAARQGIERAQGVALLFNFDYRLDPARRDAAGPLRFVGTFPYVQVGRKSNFQPVFELAEEIGCPAGAILFLLEAFSFARKQRQQVHEGPLEQLTAREYCEFLLRCRGDDTPAVLRELGLRRSEDVGRIVFAMIEKRLARRRESDSEADFAGLFDLGAPPAG
jgi:uncharacterized repeat protein (TIGR04138 family)